MITILLIYGKNILKISLINVLAVKISNAIIKLKLQKKVKNMRKDNNKEKTGGIGKIITIILIILLLPMLVVNIVIIAESFIHPNEVPGFMGWKPFITLSGSMEPTIEVGDLVITKEVDTSTLKKNDIIAFKDGEIVVTHRILDIVEENGEKKFVTKGDNNNAEDRELVSLDKVEGLYQRNIHRLGNLAIFMQTPIGILVALSIPIALYIVFQITNRVSEKKYMKNKQSKEDELQKEIERLKRENEKLSK